jgi:hypothetical protein
MKAVRYIVLFQCGSLNMRTEVDATSKLDAYQKGLENFKSAKVSLPLYPEKWMKVFKKENCDGKDVCYKG